MSPWGNENGTPAEYNLMVSRKTNYLTKKKKSFKGSHHVRISPGLWNPELSSRNPESGQLTIGIRNLSPNDKRSRIQYMESRKKNALFLSVNVFSTNLLIGDTIVTLYF